MQPQKHFSVPLLKANPKASLGVGFPLCQCLVCSRTQLFLRAHSYACPEAALAGARILFCVTAAPGTK